MIHNLSLLRFKNIRDNIRYKITFNKNSKYKF